MSKVKLYLLLTALLSFFVNVIFAQIDTNAREIPWKPIKAADILWKKRVWREISVYEMQNVALRDDPGYPQENVFANVLLSGINAGIYKAYLKVDDRSSENVFKEDSLKDEWIYSDEPVKKNDSTKPEAQEFMKPLTKDEVNSMVVCDPASLSVNSREYLHSFSQHKNDSMTVTDKETKAPYDSTAVQTCVYPQQVDKYGIIEDWIFDKGEGQMVVQIQAIAPMAHGKPLFWVPYRDIRRYIARYEAYS